jgi:S-formylglutathione hydrolase FrmB
LLVTVAGCVLCVATFTAFGSAGPARAGVTRDTEFRSAALGGNLHFEIHLPTGYATSGRRYPVIYFLHGLPAGGGDYRTIGFVQRALDRTNHEAILVVPQGARDGDADPEYLDRGPGERWETAIAHELPRVVDARFRTIASRDGRALIGVSAGGYGAMHLALKHLPDFSVVESWSGYFHPTDPTGTRALDLGSSSKNAAADVHRQARVVRGELRRLPTLIAFYVGTADARFAAENELLNQELSRAGVAHIFRLYAGSHSQALWGRYAPAWLSLALAHMTPPR